MKTPEKPKRLCADCDHYEVCQAHSHTGVLHELNANRCGLYSDRTHDRKRIAVLEQVVEEGNMQIQQVEAANTELLTKVEQLESKCRQLERERDAAVECIGKLIVILKQYPYAAVNSCAYRAYCEIQKYVENMRGVKEE